MARINVITVPIAAGASHTTGFNIGDGEYTRFGIGFPSTNPLTASADITAQQRFADTSTWFTVGYSNNPATATSGFKAWSAGRDSWGNVVYCEAGELANDLRIKFGTAATSASEVYVILGKED